MQFVAIEVMILTSKRSSKKVKAIGVAFESESLDILNLNRNENESFSSVVNRTIKATNIDKYAKLCNLLKEFNQIIRDIRMLLGENFPIIINEFLLNVSDEELAYFLEVVPDSILKDFKPIQTNELSTKYNPTYESLKINSEQNLAYPNKKE